jgi:predicted 3-demethylubiquinone-9 3-methyltransferase (glyoxalase superfamily)
MESIARSQHITPFLWFDHEAEDAAKFYCSIFKNAKITDVTRYGDAGPGEDGQVMTVVFEIDGLEFVGLNGGRRSPDGSPLGSEFDLAATSAVSFVVTCDTQADVDHLWDALTAGGRSMQCGWLKDKFGVTWQVVPAGFIDVIKDPDPERSQRGMRAMMGMEKLDINALREAVASD